jgi:uncharacterized membrane protein YkvA (DUF1232 family)
MLYNGRMKTPETHHDDAIKRVNDAAEDIEQKFAKQKALKNVLEHGKVMLSMIKDYASGKYREVPYWAIGAVALALLYLINPLDVLPDVILGIGYLDDATVIAFCMKLIENEIEKYQTWKGTPNEPKPAEPTNGRIIDV